LLGKSTSRLIIALAMGLIELPFLLLSVTLGGVTLHQIWCGFAMVAGFTVLVANLGLLCSVMCSTTAAASRSMIGLILAYSLLPILILPLWISVTISGGGATPTQKFLLEVYDWIAGTSPWTRIFSISRTGYAAHPVSSQVVSNLIGGGICFVLSWILFDRFARDLSQSAKPRPQSIFQRAKSSSRRCVGNPFVWKDFRFQAGGFKRMGFNALLLCVGMLVYTVSVLGNWSGTVTIWDDNFLGPAATIMVFVSVLHLASMGARFLSAEYREHTLPILFLTPNAGPAIVYGKLLGTFAGALPTVALTFFLWCGLILDSPWDEDILTLFLILLMYVGIYLHLVVLMSLYLKWGAVPVSVGIMLAGTFFWAVIHFWEYSTGPWFEYVVMVEMGVMLAVLHGVTAARIRFVARK
jgi:hypothetical protein